MFKQVTSLKRQASSGLPDYSEYTLTGEELALNCLIALAEIAGVSLLCYGNIGYSVILLPYIFFYLRRKKAMLAKTRLWKLNLQFADALGYLSGALQAGYSVENAIGEVYRDLRLTYSEDEIIMRELKMIVTKVGNNVPVEDAFHSFAKRSGLEDVMGFADVFSTAKRTGGNIISIIRSTTGIIRERTDIKRELRSIIAAKKYESDIMKAVPFAILLYLRVFSPDMVAALYGNIKGVIFMTVILAIYLGLSFISDRIVDIEL